MQLISFSEWNNSELLMYWRRCYSNLRSEIDRLVGHWQHLEIRFSCSVKENRPSRKLKSSSI